MTTVTISLFKFLFVIAATSISFCDGNSNVLCIGSERQALLKLKQDFVDPSNRLSSWVEGGDCCKWIGVFCHNLTGHVSELHLAPLSIPDDYAPDAEWEAYNRSKLGGKINPSLLDLKHLSFLDLSSNNFSFIPIPEFIGSLRSLTYLNLSQAQFQGAIPHELGNLSRLHYLDLRGNYELKEAKNLQWVSGLSSLQYLDLSDVNLTKATDWLKVTNKLPFLLELHLSSCNLEDDPSKISVNSTNLLAVLDLSANSLYSVPTWMFSLHGLVSIDLSYNNLEGPIPDDFRNISFLKVLDLSSNRLNSTIPNSLYSLNHLQFLSLADNHLQGKVSSFLGNLSSIFHLDLSYNMLEGKVSTSLKHLCNLKEIDLSLFNIEQELSEILRSLSNCSSDRLESLSMRLTKLYGPIPFLIGELSSLKILDVSNNQLEGIVSEMHFSNLKSLKILKASGNLLRFKPNPSWIPPFQCEKIELGHWHLGPQFPQWLKFQKNLVGLDISHAEISGVIPTWFWNLSTLFEYINLSHNQLIGGISYLPVRTLVDLSWNQFTGPLPRVFPTLKYLFLSKKLFSGSLVQFVCNSLSENMRILQIDTNLLSGEISDCWNSWISLIVLNLRNNNFTGKIPHSLGYTNLEVLNLRNNSLFGELPSILQNCTLLSVLDLSENQFSGSIPTWIGDKLSELEVLNLRSNNFHGHIPDKICALNYLQNLDLGNNNISGTIPKCFGNLGAMAGKDKTFNFEVISLMVPLDNPYIFEAVLMMKGRQDEYSATLSLISSIDLSANNLTGEISEELGNLMGLMSLNLSENLLTGQIPEKIGNMELLESLDLSMNRLYGEIPSSFSNLNFLNHLNLSYNNLTGQIPSGTQLQSFDNFSYIGNHFCGPPVTKSCSTGRTPDVTKRGSREGKNKSKVNWLYVSIVLGFVMGFWGVVAPLYFIKSWRFAYYKKLEHIGDMLYVFWATMSK